MINKDQLVEGPFGSNACYEQTFTQDDEIITTWLCFGSGFTTSTLMTPGSPVVENALATSPELYKDLMFEDKNGRVWLPATITLPAKGMVFIDGTSKDNWEWAAVNAIPLTEDEKKSGKFPKDQDFKMNVRESKKFDKRGFMDALEVIGFFKPEE